MFELAVGEQGELLQGRDVAGETYLNAMIHHSPETLQELLNLFRWRIVLEY